MNKNVRPIHVPGAAAMELLRQRAQAALESWAREWVSGWMQDERRIATLRISGLAAETHGHEYEVLRTAAGCMWFRRDAMDRLSFNRAVMGMHSPRLADDWIATATDHAWEVCKRELCSALLGTPITDAQPVSVNRLPAGLFAFGSGAVEFSCDELNLHAIADNAVWRSVPPDERCTARARPKLVLLERATHRCKVPLEVSLGSVSVELPKLLDLRCGDVLRLPQRLDQGIAVLCAGKPLARAALGVAQGRKGVQLTMAHTSDSKADATSRH